MMSLLENILAYCTTNAILELLSTYGSGWGKGLLVKRVLITTIVSVAAMLAFPLSASALSPETDVTGTVTLSGSPVDHAKVTVVCDGKQRVDFTDASGAYLVSYPIADCPAGSPVNVSATKGSDSGANSGTANKITTKLNLALVDVTISLPEMGLVTGVAAAIAAGAAFLVIRRSQA